MSRKLLALLIPAVAGLLTAIGLTVVAQDGPGPEPPSGGGSPGGSNFATQYRINATTFGGAGPGTSGQVLTSNGAGMAPTFEDAAAGGCAPSGDEFDVLLDDGAGGCTSLGAGTDGQVLTSAGAGMTPAWETAFEAGMFQLTFADACTTTPTLDVYYLRVGTFVTLSFESMSTCTSDSANFFSGTGEVPAALRPTNSVTRTFHRYTDSGTAENGGCILILSDGQVRIGFAATIESSNCAYTSWTNMGNKNGIVVQAASLSYDTAM